MVTRSFIVRLTWAAIALVVAIAVLSCLSLLLDQMGDIEGAQGTRVVALSLGVVWIVDLFVLLVALAIQNVGPREASSADKSSGGGQEDDVAS